MQNSKSNTTKLSKNFGFFNKTSIENMLMQVNELTTLVRNGKMTYKTASNRLYHAEHDLQSMYWLLARAISETRHTVKMIDRFTEYNDTIITDQSDQNTVQNFNDPTTHVQARQLLLNFTQFKLGVISYDQFRKEVKNLRSSLKDQLNATITELNDVLHAARHWNNRKEVVNLNTDQPLEYTYEEDRELEEMYVKIHNDELQARI